MFTFVLLLTSKSTYDLSFVKLVSWAGSPSDRRVLTVTNYSFCRVTVTYPHIALKIDPCHDLKSYLLVFEFQVTMIDITSLPQFVCWTGTCGYHELGRSQKCYVLKVPHTHKQPHTHTHTDKCNSSFRSCGVWFSFFGQSPFFKANH